MDYSPPKIADGDYVSTQSGLLVPRSYGNAALLQSHYLHGKSIWSEEGFQRGQKLERDKETLIIRWPAKGSGIDDYLSSAIVDGNIGNVGIAPVMAPWITALIHKQMFQAANSSIELTGRRSPVRRAREAIARFNDSPLGATDAIMQIVRNLRTYNRGAPIATVPISYDMSKWDGYGLEAVPMEKANSERYYLKVDWGKFGEAVPFLPNIFDLEPTGNMEWPYWYRATKGDERKWVLLHQSHIIPLTPGKSDRMGIGTSSVWMCLGHISEGVLVVDERIERKVNALADGILGIGGVYQSPQQIMENLEGTNEKSAMSGNVLAKGYTIITSPTNRVTFDHFRLRQEDDIDFEKRRQEMEDFISLAFQEPLSGVVTRGGVGFGSQADTTADNASDAGVGAILHLLAIALGTIYPRVQVAAKRPNDRAQRLNISTFKDFSTAINQLHSTGTIVFSPEEIRAIVNRDILNIPPTETNTIAQTATNENSSDDEDVVKKVPEQPEKEAPEEKTTPDSEDESAENEEMAALRRLISEMQVIGEALEPVIPEGSDEPLPEIAIRPDAVSTSEFDNYWPDDSDYPGMLDAEVVETEEAIEAEQSGIWVWVGATLIYLIMDENRRVDRGESLNIRDTLVEQRVPTMRELAEEVANGIIPIQSHFRAGWRRIEEAYTNQYRLGRGGINAMTPNDYGILGTMLQAEYEAWRAMNEKIAAGTYSEGQIANYNRNFVNGSRTAYERANAEAYGLPPLPQYPGDGQTDCNKGCRCSLRIYTLPGNGNFDVVWRLGDAEHCKDCIRLSRDWSPLRIRNGVIL
jgi:hypothetical protein